MTDEAALRLADQLEDLAAVLTQKAQRIRKTVQGSRHTTMLVARPEDWPYLEEGIGTAQQATYEEKRKRWLP